MEGNFDGFISVSTLNMPTLLPEIIPTIGGSRPVVIYSQFKEALLETQHHMSTDKRVLAPSIMETRVRPHQTIPGRMHPVMCMRGFGGYILWGTRVFPRESGITAVGKGSGKSKERKATTNPRGSFSTSISIGKIQCILVNNINICKSSKLPHILLVRTAFSNPSSIQQHI